MTLGEINTMIQKLSAALVRAALGLARVAFWGIVRQTKGLCLGLPMLCLAAQIFSGSAISAPQAAPAAFPGAQGGGAVSVGGRGGSVFNITNLNDSGRGSLRECAEASGPRTCIFRVGGTIRLLSPITISNPYLTIAGQSAPGGGIQVSGKGLTGSMRAAFLIQTHNVLIRYLRVRVGRASVSEEAGIGIEVRGRSGANVQSVMLDHLSLSWGLDENFTVWSQGAYIKNLTLSQSIISEGLASHSMGAIVGSHVADARNNMTGVDFHHNFIAHNNGRNPYLGVKEQSVTNNIIYNWGSEAGIMIRGGLTVDIVGNLTKPGPSSDRSSNPDDIQWFPYGSSACESSAYCVSGNPSIYLQGNAGYVNGVLSNPTADNWRMLEGWSSDQGEFSLPTSYRRTTPLPAAKYPVRVDNATRLPDAILPTVGASRRLDCDGFWVNVRDAVDTRVINSYYAGTGSIINSEADVGGFPVIANGTACTDTDRDGMPDGWEVARGLDPKNAADRNADRDRDGDGYGDGYGDGWTNLEEYLEGHVKR